MLKKNGISTGLGDRLGNYLIYAMIGEILNKDIYTTWIYEENSYSERGSQYPDDIHEYISFPKRLKFLTKDEFNNFNVPFLHYTWIYHGFDYIPETIYRSLKEDGIINISFDEMINIYRKVCGELYYKKDLPINFNKNIGIIHLRRGDKGNNTDHNKRILKLVNYFDDKVNNWIITSDSKISNNLINKINKLIYPKWSDDIRKKTLEIFFTFSHCSIIIQSVNLQKNHNSTWSGWAGFSYIPFQLGLALNKNQLPILVSCNTDNENTRLTHAKKFAKRELFNIYMYNNIIK